MLGAADDITYDLGLLAASRDKWLRSSGLRLVYGALFERIGAWCRPGRTLELGSGIGVSREFLEGVVTSDVAPTGYVDRTVSCYEVDRSGVWANLVAVDVLHHLCSPVRFLEHAARALEPGGRLLLAEPAATAGARCFYRLFHHEPMDLDAVRPPFEFAPRARDRGFANMAMAHGLFLRHRRHLEPTLARAGLRLTHVAFSDLLAYPLSGGYSKPQLAPSVVLRAVLEWEKSVPGSVLERLGLRMLVVLERI